MLGCIVAGLGGRGRHWIGHVQRRNDVRVAACVEPVEELRSRAIEQYGLPEGQVHSSLADALRDADADFLLDVTPPSAHAAVAEAAFGAGLHVLGEKPLSDDFGTALRMAAWGRQAGRKHMLTQNYRFGACPRTTRQKLSEGIIGTPGQCDVRFYRPWADNPGSHYVTQPFMLMNDMMVHHFDLMRYVLDRDPVSVQAITWNHPWGWHQGDAAHAVVFRFPDGLVATHVSCGCAVGSQTTWNGDWRIEGPGGSIDWEADRMWHNHLHRTDRKTREEIFPLPVPAPEQAILDEFFAAIRENREPECGAADNLKSLAMVFAAIRSAQEGRPVELAELGAPG